MLPGSVLVAAALAPCSLTASVACKRVCTIDAIAHVLCPSGVGQSISDALLTAGGFIRITVALYLETSQVHMPYSGSLQRSHKAN